MQQESAHVEDALREFLPALGDLVRVIAREEISRAQAEAKPHADYLTTAEAATLARVAPDTIRRWIREGKLRACNAGREIRVRLEDLDYLLRAGRRRQPSEDLTDREVDAMVERDFG